MANYPIPKISFSALRTFFRNEGEFKDRYILNDSRRVYRPAQLVGSMAHKVLELFFTGVEIDKAKENARNWLDTIKDEEIVWGKEGSRQKVLETFNRAVDMYFEELPDYGKIQNVEHEKFFTIKDVVQGKTITSPLPFHGRTDLDWLCAENFLHVEDYKFVTAFSDPEKENPVYIMQAFFYYYLSKAFYGREPRDCTFREVKISKNRDLSSQHNLIVVPFYGKAFEENKVYFWYIVSGFCKKIENADETTLFLHNIFDMTEGAENFQRMKETVFGYNREEVKSSEFSEVKERGEKVVKFLEASQAHTVEDKIKSKASDHGVSLKFDSVERGFSYDRFLFEPGRGMKMAKVASLTDELKLVLEVKHLRIEAPVPGTKFVGVEVPKSERVYIPYEPSNEVGKIPLGKGIDGVTRFLDLKDANTPHAFAVGRTGSGKSEFLKVAVESLKNDFDLYLIDPKRTELAQFEQFAKFYSHDPEQVFNTLVMIYNDMMKRYGEISGKGHKDIEEFNKKAKRKLRRVAIIIEEYALLKLSHLGKEIERVLLQIAALGRAAGYHIIVSTQRPEVAIISGAFKANISARVCFAVSSQIDSKVALDEIGAENLMGKGDMLYRNPGHDLERLQSFYIQ